MRGKAETKKGRGVFSKDTEGNPPPNGLGRGGETEQPGCSYRKKEGIRVRSTECRADGEDEGVPV